MFIRRMYLRITAPERGKIGPYFFPVPKPQLNVYSKYSLMADVITVLEARLAKSKKVCGLDKTNYKTLCKHFCVCAECC